MKAADGDAAPESDMHMIQSYAQAEDDNNWIFACGYRYVDP